MMLTAELNKATDEAIQAHAEGDVEMAQNHFALILLSACSASGDAVSDHIGCITRLLEARLTEEVMQSHNVKGQIDQIMNGMSETGHRLNSFSLLFREYAYPAGPTKEV